MKISFCSFNEQKDDVIKLLKDNYPEFETSINRCIYSCGSCSSKPIARINGELFIAGDAGELVKQIVDFSKIHKK